MSAFMKTLQHWRIRDLQGGRLFDSSTVQDIVTRHLALLQSINQSVNYCLLKTNSSWHIRNWNTVANQQDEKFVGAKFFWSGLLKTVSFFFWWVYSTDYTDWTFFWHLLHVPKNQSSKLLDLQNFGFIISKWI